MKSTKRTPKQTKVAKLSAAANKAWATRRKNGNPRVSALVAWETRRAFAA